jgi:hypothetical protein
MCGRREAPPATVRALLARPARAPPPNRSQAVEAGGVGWSPARRPIVDDSARGTPARGATYFSSRARPLALSSMPMPMIVPSMIVPRMLITAVRPSVTVPDGSRQPSPMTPPSSARPARATRTGLDSTLISAVCRLGWIDTLVRVRDRRNRCTVADVGNIPHLSGRAHLVPGDRKRRAARALGTGVRACPD